MRRTPSLAFAGLFANFVHETAVLAGVVVATPFALAAVAAASAIQDVQQPQSKKRVPNTSSVTASARVVSAASPVAETANDKQEIANPKLVDEVLRAAVSQSAQSLPDGTPRAAKSARKPVFFAPCTKNREDNGVLKAAIELGLALPRR